ncbi:hypothetical protein CC1G_04477 [Coprinopsis cinerea okayama7|uniref:Uncharacterized protein n=1 Tax=Coprinopsis cinerea (strain Okayama-7 / 130 / ATCC MYA-4618 / FGSC 9003) TaxID=240176 RepID=A8N599_COPC7|nr:hypothetical protein CC1G_04477 [Coprinopsis cinerea okayama7\|eukprot:XP_001830044.2 hypothetical protein CC1G_04477 [Coprinopsis cinerea okayama7\
MPMYTAPALLVGLGTRILIDTVNQTAEPPTLGQSILQGVWQGVALQYAGKNTAATLLVGAGIVVKLLFDFMASQDATRCMSTIIGVALGVVGTDLLASQFDPYFSPPSRSSRDRSSSKSYRTHESRHRYDDDIKPQRSSRQPDRPARSVQWRASVQGGSVTTQPTDPRPQSSAAFTSDITSVDSATGLISSRRASSMTPLEREIAALRARASLADSERRRCREERKWALSQGNLALASELKANYKRFKALMEECHREADAKLLEDAREKDMKSGYEQSRQDISSSNLRDQVARILREESSKNTPTTSTPRPERRQRKISSSSKPSPRTPNR